MDELKPVKFKAVPKEQPNIGIEHRKTLINLLKDDSGLNGQVDTSAINSFRTISDLRETLYTNFDEMSRDVIVSAALDLYADDSTEYGDSGKIIWATSSKPEVQTIVNRLLKSLKLDENAWLHIHHLVKYGDLYLETFRRSEVDEEKYGSQNVIKNTQALTEGKLDNGIRILEDLIVNIYKSDDRLQEYIELVNNPAEIFDLTKRGKTVGYIKTNVTPKRATSNNLYSFNYDYTLHTQDINLYDPTKYIHINLPDTSKRVAEQVKLFTSTHTNNSQTDLKNAQEVTFNVKRGKSVLYDLFSIYREMKLLEDSILLNRITRSALVRIIQVEVGEMGKSQTQQLLGRIKSLFEQKTAIGKDVGMGEYNNPGPVENNVYMPTRGGLGALSLATLGGDFNVGQLTDLDYFNNKFFAGIKIPKQYLGFVDDNAGFSGGDSLMRVSSRYSKTIKRIKNAYMQGITTLINVFLLDKGLNSYVNDFTIQMVTPTTVEDTERSEILQDKLTYINSIMGTLPEIEDPVRRLEMTRTLLAEVVTNEEFMELLTTSIEELAQTNTIDAYSETSDELNNETNDFDDSEETIEEPKSNIDEIETIETENEINLPNPNDFDVDFTDNEQIANELGEN